MINLKINFVIFTLLIVFQNSYSNKLTTKNIYWKDLTGLNTETGKIDKNLSELLKHPVSISGFGMPLEMGKAPNTFIEAVLVPDLMICYHVPSPPANQVIEVFLDKEAPLHLISLGVNLTGILKVVEIKGRDYNYGFHFYVSKIISDENYSGTFVEDPAATH